MTIEYAYSGDEEHFYEDLESAIDCIDPEAGETVVSLFRGEIERKSHSEFLCTDSLIEEMRERAYDNFHEHAESYLDDMSEDKIKELESHILQWFSKNADKPNFYTVKNVHYYKTDI